MMFLILIYILKVIGFLASIALGTVGVILLASWLASRR